MCFALAATLSTALVGCDGEGEKGGKKTDACGRTCPDGRSCNAETGRCECTSSPDSCEPYGLICSSAKICVEKPPPADEATEWTPCAVAGDRDGSGRFVCLPTTLIEANVWVRLCEDNDACVDRTTVCKLDPGGSSERVCWFNECGEDAVERTSSGKAVVDSNGDPVYLNGLNWGPCDTETGAASNPSSGEGSCLPAAALGAPRFLCHASGSRRLGEWCKPDGDRNDWEACEQGGRCVPPPVYQKSCFRDHECHSTQYCTGGIVYGPNGVAMDVIGFCDALECAKNEDCGSEGYCEDLLCKPLGACLEVCNGGSAGPDAGEFAACSPGPPGVDFVCSGELSTVPGATEHISGYCQSSCDLFGADSCSSQLGEDAICVPAPTPSNPLGGACLAVGSELVVSGGTGCLDASICETGYVCRSALGQGNMCRRLCICEGEGGWDEYGRCLTSASQCDPEAEEVCYQMEVGNPSLGACVGPKKDGPP